MTNYINSILREDYEKEKNELHRDNLRSYHREIENTFNENFKNIYIEFLNEHPKFSFEEQEAVRLFYKKLLSK